MLPNPPLKIHLMAERLSGGSSDRLKHLTNERNHRVGASNRSVVILWPRSDRNRNGRHDETRFAIMQLVKLKPISHFDGR
jgi:hypothetical protein